MMKTKTLLAASFTTAALLVGLPTAASYVTARGPAAQPALVAPYPYAAGPARGRDAEIAVLQRRIRQDPAGGLDLAALAGAYLRQAQATGDANWYLLAEQAARRSLANLPMSNGSAWLVLAQVAGARHDFRESRRLAARAADEGASNGEVAALLVTTDLALGEVPRAASVADRLVRTLPMSAALLLRAQARLAHGQEAGALSDLHQALAREQPGEAEMAARIRQQLSRVHLRRGRLALAGELLREAARIAPRSHAVLASLAEWSQRAGQLEEAERQYRAALAIAPHPAYLLGLGRVLAARGDTSAARQAEAEAEAALRRELAGGGYGHRRELARLLLARGRASDTHQALALMDAEIRLRQDAETWDTLAWARQASGKLAEARVAIDQALRWAAPDASVLYRAGQIEQALGNGPAARRRWREALGLAPQFPEAAAVRRALATPHA